MEGIQKTASVAVASVGLLPHALGACVLCRRGDRRADSCHWLSGMYVCLPSGLRLQGAVKMRRFPFKWLISPREAGALALPFDAVEGVSVPSWPRSEREGLPQLVTAGNRHPGASVPASDTLCFHCSSNFSDLALFLWCSVSPHRSTQ